MVLGSAARWPPGWFSPGLWAADVSTASALLIGSATLVTDDIVKRFVAPDLAGCAWSGDLPADRGGTERA